MEESRDTAKPEMITYYNKSKSGVDIVDKLCIAYNMKYTSLANGGLLCYVECCGNQFSNDLYWK